MHYVVIFCLAVYCQTASSAPPAPIRPPVSKADQWARNLLRSQPTNSDPYQLARQQLRRQIEPAYFMSAISNLNSALIKQVKYGKIPAKNAQAESDSLMGLTTPAGSPSESEAMSSVVAPPKPTRLEWSYTNRLEAIRIAIGQTVVSNGVTNGWNVIDSAPGDDYPAYTLATATNLSGPRTVLTNFPQGTASATIPIAPTNRSLYFFLSPPVTP